MRCYCWQHCKAVGIKIRILMAFVLWTEMSSVIWQRQSNTYIVLVGRVLFEEPSYSAEGKQLVCCSKSPSFSILYSIVKEGCGRWTWKSIYIYIERTAKTTCTSKCQSLAVSAYSTILKGPRKYGDGKVSMCNKTKMKQQEKLSNVRLKWRISFISILWVILLLLFLVHLQDSATVFTTSSLLPWSYTQLTRMIIFIAITGLLASDLSLSSAISVKSEI